MPIIRHMIPSNEELAESLQFQISLLRLCATESGEVEAVVDLARLAVPEPRTARVQ